MSNQYRAVNPSLQAMYGEDVFEHEFGSADEERDMVDRGLLERVPRPYRVLVDNYTVDGQPVDQGAVLETSFPMEIEAALISAGVLERARRDAKPTVEHDPVTGDLADPAELHPTPKKTAAKRTAKTKE